MVILLCREGQFGVVLDGKFGGRGQPKQDLEMLDMLRGEVAH